MSGSHRIECTCETCDSQYKISFSTRRNHKKDDRIARIQATFDRYQNVSHGVGPSGSTIAIPQPVTGRHNQHQYPHPGPAVPAGPPHTTQPHGGVVPQPANTGQHVAPPGSNTMQADGGTVLQTLAVRPPRMSQTGSSGVNFQGVLTAVGLMEGEIQSISRNPVASLGTPLVFVLNPAENGLYDPEDLFRYPDGLPNRGTYRLDPRAPANQGFLEHENHLWQIAGEAHLLPACVQKHQLEQQIWGEILRCSREKELHWNQQRLQVDRNQLVVHTEVHFVPLPHEREPAVLASMILTAMMTKFFFVPRVGGTVLLGGLQDLLAIVNQGSSSLPSDPRTVVKQLRLDPVTEKFICCPKCWALTPMASDRDRSLSLPVPTCQEKLTSSSNICGHALWRVQNWGGKPRWSPQLTYIHQPLRYWLGRFLSRPGIEDLLERYPIQASEPGDYMDDIWSSPLIRGLKGPDGKPFLEAPEGELRLLFGYAVDGFNPFYNKTAKQVVTTTGFWLVLYNLPPAWRYLFDKLCYSGSAAGPNEPTVGRLNPFQDVMVQELLEFWNKGVFFTRTFKYHSGRNVRAMLIPLTADMLGIRQAAGLTSPTSRYFCVGCHLDTAHIEEFDRSKWPLRKRDEHMKAAEAWKNAPNERAQERIAQETGIRWTPLLLLPYWIIVLYLLIEGMHALDLGLIEHHSRNLFRIDLSQTGGDGSGPRMPRPLKPGGARRQTFLKDFLDHYKAGGSDHAFLREMLQSNRSPYAVLWHICNDLGLRVSGGSQKRVWYLLRIKKWKEQNHLSDEDFVRRGCIIPDPQDRFTLEQLMSEAEKRMSAEAQAHRYFDSETEVQIDDCYERIRQIYRGTKLGSMRGRKGLLAKQLAMTCRLNSIASLSGQRELNAASNEDLYQALRDLVEKEKEQRLLPRSEPMHGAVLGADVMNAIWADMRVTVLPSWVGVAPKNWGTTRRGKLSADQWRTVFTIHLVITLIWIWQAETGRKKLLLSNMLDLVIAVRVANLRETNRDIAAKYDEHLSRYLEQAAKLFPEDNITPNMHCASHIGDNLRDFGPSHSRGAQFYERYIHYLQRQNTNMKFGQLEATMMDSTAHAANLQAILTDNPTVRSLVSGAVKARERAPGHSFHVDLDIALSRILDTAAKEEWGMLQPEHRRLLFRYLQEKHGGDFQVSDWQSAGVILQETSIGGVKYRRRSQSRAQRTQSSSRDQSSEDSDIPRTDVDSHIIFQLPNSGLEVPGQIVNIFRFAYRIPDGSGFSNVETIFLVVNWFSTEPILGDPYRAQHAMFGYLCPAKPIGTALVEGAQVLSHFAPTPRKSNDGTAFIHVLPLSRLDLNHWWRPQLTAQGSEDPEDIGGEAFDFSFDHEVSADESDDYVEDLDSLFLLPSASAPA